MLLTGAALSASCDGAVRTCHGCGHWRADLPQAVRVLSRRRPARASKEQYGKPLAGDRSVAQLAQLIAKSMPKDDPGTCAGADADKVAAYIYDAFYSKAARIDLSRLTVRQHQNAIADLIAGFRTPARWDDKRGLHGEYFGNPPLRRPRSSTGSTPRSVSTSRTTAPTRRSSRRSSPSAGRGRSSPRKPATTNSSSAPRTAPGSGSTITKGR